MKKIILLLCIIFISIYSYAQNQNEVRASMGIDFVSVPSVKDYIDQRGYEQLADFNSAVNFSGSYSRMITETYQLQIELGYLLYSFNTFEINGQYDLSYNLIMPSILYYYVLNGTGYNFKFGGGAGIRLLAADESLPGTGSTQTYTSLGFGFILRAEGNTAISKDVYAHIAADIRYDINGEPEYNGIKLYNIVEKKNVNFNSLSVGIRLGVSYQF